MKRIVSPTGEIFNQVDREVFKLDKGSGTDSGEVNGFNGAVRLLAYCSTLGAKSVHDCPDKLKTFGDTFGLPKVSSSTIHNMISLTSAEISRAYAYIYAKTLYDKGMFKVKLQNKKKRSVTVLHLDGSKVMTHYGQSATFGGKIHFAPDFVVCERGGQEIAKSKEICARAKEYGIQVDIATNDGIAYAQNYFSGLAAMGIDAFIRIRGNDKRNLQVVSDFENALKIRSALNMPTSTATAIYDDIKYTVTQIVEFDPHLNKTVTIAKIESEPVGKKLERLKRKEAKKKKKQENNDGQNFQYEWEKDDDWEEMSEYYTTHYVVTTATYLTPLDVLNIYVEHWTIETHWRKVKRAYWSRNSYKKSPEDVVTLFIAVSMGIAITEEVKHEALLCDTDEAKVIGIQVLRYPPQEEKDWTLKRVRDYVSEVARSKYFEIAAAA